MRLKTIFCGMILAGFIGGCNEEVQTEIKSDVPGARFQFVSQELILNQDTLEKICIHEEGNTWSLSLKLKNSIQEEYQALTTEHVGGYLVLTDLENVQLSAIIREPLSGTLEMEILFFETREEAEKVLYNFFQMEESPSCSA